VHQVDISAVDRCETPETIREALGLGTLAVSPSASGIWATSAVIAIPFWCAGRPGCRSDTTVTELVVQ